MAGQDRILHCGTLSCAKAICRAMIDIRRAPELRGKSGDRRCSASQRVLAGPQGEGQVEVRAARSKA
eukprot:9497855-Pyramimonas_sp.AAC.1